MGRAVRAVGGGGKRLGAIGMRNSYEAAVAGARPSGSGVGSHRFCGRTRPVRAAAVHCRDLVRARELLRKESRKGHATEFLRDGFPGDSDCGAPKMLQY